MSFKFKILFSPTNRAKSCNFDFNRFVVVLWQWRLSLQNNSYECLYYRDTDDDIAVSRQYTPVSDISCMGHFDLLIKVMKGKLSVYALGIKLLQEHWYKIYILLQGLLNYLTNAKSFRVTHLHQVAF
jgi:hypothetical protein